MLYQTAQTCEYDVHVIADDIDEIGHVNNAVYLKWVQAAFLNDHIVARFLPLAPAALEPAETGGEGIV